MPVIKALPSPEIIKGLRGILDFYCWRGLNCVRSWPHIPPSHRTAKSLASAALFGLIVQGYALLGGALKTLFAEDAADQTRTARDLYISAVLGHLHEASMSDFLDLLTKATAYLEALAAVATALESDGGDSLLVKPAYDDADWQALLVDAQRHLQADVLASALPTGAATAAHQVTQNTALALIQKLEAALESVHTDRLKVRGEDQLYSFNGVLAVKTSAQLTSDNGYIESPPVPEGEIWKITTIAGINEDRVTTEHRPYLVHDNTAYYLGSEVRNFPPLTPSRWIGETWADYQDTLRIIFIGGLENDWTDIYVTGHRMTLET